MTNFLLQVSFGLLPPINLGALLDLDDGLNLPVPPNFNSRFFLHLSSDPSEKHKYKPRTRPRNL